MKRLLDRNYFLIVFLIGLAPLGHAQGCRVDYTPNYDVYTTMTTDGTYIYTTVLTDGSTTGNGGAGCNYPTATHTAKSLNTIGSVGGWMSGTPQCMNCYESIQNDQQVDGSSGQTFAITGDGEVDCSVFGVFYSYEPVNITARITVATYINTTSPPGYVYRAACPGTTRASCGTANLQGSQQFMWAEEFNIYTNQGGCLGINLIVYLNGPPAPLPCD